MPLKRHFDQAVLLFVIRIACSNAVMKFKSPSLPELHAFLAVCHHGSFSRSAQALFVTQAAVSRAVQRLEARLNCHLFKRTADGVAPTEKGLAFQALVESHVAGLENATALFNSVHNQASKTKNKLRLSVIPTLGTRWLIPRLPQFQAAHPEVSVELRQFHHVWIDVKRTKAWPRGYKHIYLLGKDIAPICAPAMASRLGRVEDLLNETLLHHTNFPDNWAVWLHGAGLPKAQPELGPGFDLGSNLIVAATIGMGVAVIHPFIVARELASGELVMPFRLTVSTGRGYYACYRNAQAQNPTVQAFVVWLKEQAKNTVHESGGAVSRQGPGFMPQA
jgi:LysR family transcriptional regulator, glycine cleavage system transcriptional activator